MSDTVFVKPAIGATVQDPETFTTIPEAGMEITLTVYWRKRINDGSLVVVAQTPEVKSEESAVVESANTSRRK